MSERIANIIILAEDQEQQNLIRRYLLKVGHSSRTFRLEALPGDATCGSQFGRERFADQVLACRGILGKKTSCLLIVMTDADNLTVIDRERELSAQLSRVNIDAISENEPIIILIPKWQVETWIKCLLGKVMDEDDKKSDQPPVNPADVKQASEILYQWTRNGATIPNICVPSLRNAIPKWRRLEVG